MNAIIVLALAGLALGVPVAEEKLEFVTFVHRHGDRTPVATYPTDPHSTHPWYNGWGELTTAGKQTTYKLGQWIRERYANFLPKIYRTADYQGQSTDMSRTLMSGYLVLAGMYEPTEGDVWNSRIHWQPIPLHTIPMNLDHVLAAQKPCPKHSRLLQQFLLSKEFADMLQPYAHNLTEIAKHAGYNTTNTVTNFFSASQVYDAIKVQSENGLAVPKWTQAYFPQPMSDLNSLALRLATYKPPLQRLSCGPLVEDILNHFKAKAEGRLEKKMWHYSAHDVTIAGLRQCLGFRNPETCPYGSALILELISDKGKYFVKIVFKTQELVRTLVMPGCTELCPLQKFEELVRPIIPEDWEAECK